MDADGSSLELTIPQSANDVLNTNLERLRVNAGLLSSKNLCSFMDFVIDDSFFGLRCRN